MNKTLIAAVIALAFLLLATLLADDSRDRSLKALLFGGRRSTGYFLTVFILLIAAAAVGYVAGHGPNRPVPAAAATDKPAALAAGTAAPGSQVAGVQTGEPAPPPTRSWRSIAAPASVPVQGFE